MYKKQCHWLQPAIGVTLILRSDRFIDNKLLYWIPVVGVFVSLMNYDKDNGMSAFWNYYQAGMIVVCIWIMTFISL